MRPGAGEYFDRIWRLRHFWIALVRIDLRARYRRSMIGVGWSLLHPIAMTIVLCTVFANLFGADLRTFGPFLLSGLVTWAFLVATVNGGCQCFLQGESYIRQHPAPLAIYPLRTVLGAAIHFLLGLIVVLILTWSLRGFDDLPALVCLLPALLLLFVLGWSLAVCMGVVNVFFQDTQHLVEVLLQILFYLTPIIYPPSLMHERGMGWMIDYNPLAVFMDLIRQPILEGQVPSATHFATATLTAGIAATVATLTLRRMEPRIIFYL